MPCIPRAILQDRVPLLRLGVALVLDGEALVLDSVDDGPALVRACVALRPDLVLCAIADPDVRHTVRECRAAVPGLRIVAFHPGRRTDHVALADELDVELLAYSTPEGEVRATVRGETVPVTLDPPVDARRTPAVPVPTDTRDLLGLLAAGASWTAATDALGLDLARARRATRIARLAFGAESLTVVIRRARLAGVCSRRTDRPSDAW